MKDTKQKIAVREFIDQWKGRGDEKGESQTFWLCLLRDVLGVEHPESLISFENRVKLANTSFIDGYIDSTHVMIEQKSLDKDLRAPIRQSDGSMLTPFQQAKRYATELPYSKRPRWVVVCNFQTFLIYDMEQPQGEPFEVLLENLEKDYTRLNFLVDQGNEELRHEMEISLKAGEMVGKIYDAFMKQFGDDLGPRQFHSLNALCVRLVFCLYAEDAGVFEKDQFFNYMRTFQVENMRIALRDLFQVLDTPVDERDPFLEDKLKAFPYVNGFLFRLQPSEYIPQITQDIADLLLDHASLDFDWSEISPTIFGAVFESTLNPDTRRAGGMHYTSIENIHKVIDPLFLDDLKAEFEEIKQIPVERKRREKLAEFQDKLAELRFFDPACGSGNFLTESYISLRRLENKVIECMTGGQTLLGFEEDNYNPIKVKIKQFFGIEINDFAVTVATTALWIAEAQMMAETERIIQFNLEYLPLKRYSNIHEANALRVDWKELVPYTKISYVIGNPPFIGASMMTKEQKTDAVNVFGKIKLSNSIDYVGAWYFKVAELIKESAKYDNTIRAALVSTNSITQGEQVAALWKPLVEKYSVHIDFAYRTFRWDSESNQKAHVHCVIIGFSCNSSNKPRIIINEGGNRHECKEINPYLIDAPLCFVESRGTPICNVAKMTKGNQPSDGGALILTKEQRDDIITREPILADVIKPYIGSYEYINNKARYCFWLANASPAFMKNSTEIYQRLEQVRSMREKSSAAPTRAKAQTPHLFFSLVQPTTNYLMIPRVSSERRRYIPIGIMSPDIIASDSCSIIHDASMYSFGIITSNVHMAWMRAVAGRLKSDYRYSGSVVYNNFPWPTPTDEQKAKIEQTAQAILDARALYPDSSLADLYDEVTMPPELRRAHQDNDRAVMAAYGFPVKGFSESDCVAELLKMYKELTK